MSFTGTTSLHHVRESPRGRGSIVTGKTPKNSKCKISQIVFNPGERLTQVNLHYINAQPFNYVMLSISRWLGGGLDGGLGGVDGEFVPSLCPVAAGVCFFVVDDV